VFPVEMNSGNMQ